MFCYFFDLWKITALKDLLVDLLPEPATALPLELKVPDAESELVIAAVVPTDPVVTA